MKQHPNGIPITKPFFGIEEEAAIRAPLHSGWVVQGPYVREFEGKFSAFTDSRFSIATSSCTTALHIAVAALGLKPRRRSYCACLHMDLHR